MWLDLSHLIAVFLESLAAVRGLKPASLKRYRSHLHDFLAFAGPVTAKELTPALIERYVGAKRAVNRPGTLRNKVMALWAFCNFLERRRLLPQNPCREVDRVRVEPAEPVVFTDAQTDLLLALPDTRTEVGLRDFALLMTLLGTGMRISEALKLQVSDLDFGRGEIRVRQGLTKTGRSRLIPMHPGVKEALQRYLARRDLTGNAEDSHVFTTVRGRRSGRPLPPGKGGLSRSAVALRLKQYVERSGMQWSETRVSPHTFRHTFATRWVRDGGDTESLSRILGHRCSRMLRYYVNLAIGDLQRKDRLFNPLGRVDRSRVESLRRQLNR